MTKQPSIAKITQPRFPAVLNRKRLFAFLDQGRRAPVTWIMGPGGAGKTTLVASWLEVRALPCLWYHLDESDEDLATFFYYLGLAAKKAAPRVKKPLPLLTPEYLQGIPAFTKRYFENLCARLNSPAVIVFDNYHHIPAESAFHAMIRDAISVIPDGVYVVINSRGAPPSSLSTLIAYGKLNTIGWNDLRFDKEEIEDLIRYEQKARLSEEQVKRIETMTTGWAAGIVLMLHRLGSSAPDVAEREQFRPEEFFDYFASEFFEKTDAERQDFLLKTSFMPRITPRTAASLTGNEDAKKLLTELSRNHFFTERRSLSDPVYQYHPLFREFLRARARETFVPKDLLNLQRRAAESLENAGQTEDAAELFRASGSWDGLSRIILANAQTMMSQGRSRPLETWLDGLPSVRMERDPWLLYWKGACRMPLHLPESHKYFERALVLFRQKNDAAGVFRAWSGAVESLVQEMGNIKKLDAWVTLAFDLMKEYPFPSREIEDEVTARVFTAIPWNPANRRFTLWRRKALEMIERDGDPSLRMMTAFYLFFHHIWIGDFATGRAVLDVIMRLIKTRKDLSPLAHSMGSLCEGWYAWSAGDLGRCLLIMEESLRQSDESGVRIWGRNIMMMGIGAYLCANDTDQAERLLDRMAVGLEHARLYDCAYYHGLKAWFCCLKNDFVRAISHQEKAADLALKTNFPITVADAHCGMAFIKNALGSPEEARQHAAAVHETGARMGSALVEHKALLIDAFLDFNAGDDRAGLQRLQSALTLGREKGFVYYKWWVRTMMTRLCMKALETETEVDHVRHLVRLCNLVPDEPPVHLGNWPWPVRIFTLGGFRLLVNDKPAAFAGKVQKKPLDMLKALIALGGSEIREDRLTDALWPDAEADAAGASYRTTLHRLRQLIGHEQAIVVREGRVSLDPRYCWTDVRAFEHSIELGEYGVRSSTLKIKAGTSAISDARPEIIPRLEKALSFYRGHFLADESDKPWTASLRERLKRKFMQATERLGSCWIAAGQPKKAMECYEMGLDIDDLAEEFYRGLMDCNLRLGRKAEAVKVYQRCKTALESSLGVGPSEETEKVCRRIRA